MDFARRCAWQLRRPSKSELDRNFVTCQPLAAERDDRTGIGCCAGVQEVESRMAECDEYTAAKSTIKLKLE